MKRALKCLITLITLLAVLLPAAGAAAETTGECVLPDGSKTPDQTLLQCGILLGAAGAKATLSEVYGAWNGAPLRVTDTGEVYVPAGPNVWQLAAVLPDSDGDGIAYDACPNEPETANGINDADGCPDSSEDLVNLAVPDIDTFWRQQFAQLKLPYTPPAVVQAYTADQPIQTACGESVPGNAFYCGRDNSIYYDRGLLDSILQTPQHGDFGVITVIAHEWGHLAQAQLPARNVPRIGQRIELQADCFAGAYGRYIADGHSSVLQRSQGDLLQGAATLFSFGDQLPWFNPQAHGSPRQRATAYSQGLRNFTTCMRYR